MSGRPSGTEGVAAAPPHRTALGRYPLVERAAPVQPPTATPRTDQPAPAHAGEPWADPPYARALRTARGPLFLRRLSASDPPQGPGWRGDLLPLDVERWCAAPDAADTSVLHRCLGPVLDAGCGPGRMVVALSARGTPALGVDVSPAAVAHTRRRGGRAVRRSVFDRLPAEGRWSTALLMDGNIGMGGDPVALLARLRALVTPGGRLLVEVAAHDVDEHLTVRVEDARGRHGCPFPWARLGTTALLRAAAAADWHPTDAWTAGGRPFMALHRPDPGRHEPHPTPTARPDHR